MARPIFKSDGDLYTKPNIWMTANFKWTIDNFPDLDISHHEETKSSSFTCGGREWFLSIVNECDGSLSLFLNPGEWPTGTVDAKFQFHLLDSEERIIFSGAQLTQSFETHEAYGEGEFQLRSEILDPTKGFLTNNQLIIGIELKVNANCKFPSTNTKNFSTFLADQTFTDVEIENADGKKTVCSQLKIITIRNHLPGLGETKRAHKIILAQSSPVFARMFSNQMKEGLQSRAEITNFSAETLNKMLNYIYTSEINKTESVDLIKELLRAADQYEILPLKELCESILLENLGKSFEDAIGLFEAGHLFGCLNLKAFALQTIKANKTTILNTSGWKEFYVRNPDLAQEAMCMVANVNPNKRSIDQVDGEINVQPNIQPEP